MLGGRAMPSRQLVWLLPLLVQTGESHQYIRGAATAVRPQTKASIGMESTPCMHSAFYFFTKQREISVSDERNQNKPGVSRRGFLKGVGAAVGGAALIGATPSWLRSTAWAAGSDKPEKTDLTIGFIPLTDCASVVMAYELGLYKKYGLNVTVSKEASWAAVRDTLVQGELAAAHVQYGLIYGVHLGTSGPQKDKAVLMNLNNNGQAITLSKQLKEKGVTDGARLKKLVDSDKRVYTFALTFPSGTHAMWLYYWLAANGIHPFYDVKTIVVPPPQMVANMRVGAMDGFCVGEPWNARAIFDKLGFTDTTTQEIWKGHPEKVLGTTAEFVLKYPNTTRAMLMAVMEASIYIDATANRAKVAKIISGKSYVNAPEDVIQGRFLGHYDNGIGKKWEDPNYMKFYNDGAVNFPYLSDGMWFLTQHRRWGLLTADPDYLGVAKKINQLELYKQAAAQLKIPVPKDTMRPAKLIDGVTWDAKNPAQYASGFKIKA